MAGNEVKLLYSTSVAVLGLVCFVVGATAVGIPTWGYFDTHRDYDQQGYFGLWQTCIFLLYNSTEVHCVRGNPNFDTFHPSVVFARSHGCYSLLWLFAVYSLFSKRYEEGLKDKSKVARSPVSDDEKAIEAHEDVLLKSTAGIWLAGLVACVGVAVLGVFCILSVLQLVMISFKKKVILKYRSIVLIKVVLSCVSALLATVATSIFVNRAYDDKDEFEIIKGPGFYIEVLGNILTSILFAVSLYDMILARREGRDATTTAMPVELTTHLNPGPGKGI